MDQKPGVGQPFNTCKPSCAQGSFTKVPAEVELYKARTCLGKPTYKKITVTTERFGTRRFGISCFGDLG